MKILHTIDTGGMYGKERMLLELIKSQIVDGHTVHVVGFGNPELFEAIKGICTLVERYDTVQSFWCKLTVNNNYDVIHTHDYKTGIITGVWHMMNRNRVVIRTLHGYTGKVKSMFSKIWLYETLDKILLRTNNVNVGVSEELCDKYCARLVFNGISRYNMFAIDDIQRREEIVDFCRSGINGYDKAFVFCTMARLSPEKNLGMLIDAIFEIDQAKLLIFGDGPLREELEEKTTWNSKKVLFAGYDPHSKDYLQFVDGYIQPSLYEGLPISVLEAMSACVPLIVSPVGGMMPLIHAGAASRCTTSASFTMAASMLNFMADHKKRTYTSQEGLRLFKERFSAGAMYKQYNAIYLSQTMSMEANQCVE